MRPLRLELEGFGSYRLPQNVSFDDLSLFAIAGPTGAGKTLLLDAITYALYGQTARLGNRGLDVLISPGAERLLVALEFEGATGGVHRVLRTAERKASGSVVRNTVVERLDEIAKWRRLPESERLREADALLESIIGLDYDAFSRAVLLPQGRFDQFLHGDASKRRELLKTLLGLGRLDDMREAAGARRQRVDAEAVALRNLLEGEEAVVEPSVLAALKEDIARLEAELAEVDEALPRIAAAMRELETLQDDLGRLAQTRSELERLALVEADLPALKTELERGRAAEPLLPRLEGVERLEAAVATDFSEIARLAEEAANAEETAAELTARAEETAAELAAREPGLLGRLERLRGIEQLLARLVRRGDLQLPAAAESAGEWDEAVFEETQSLLGHVQAVVRAERMQLEARTRLAEAVAGRQRQQELLAAAKTAVAALLEEGKAAAALVTELAGRLEHARHRDLAAAVRSGLEPGDPCPVCGGVITTLPAEAATDLSELTADHAAATGARDELRDRYQRALRDVAAAEAGAGAGETAVAEAEAALARAVGDLLEARGPFVRAGLAAGDESSGELEAQLKSRRDGLLAALAAQVRGLAGTADPATALGEVTAELEQARKVAAAASQESARAASRTAATAARLAARREAALERQAELEEARAGVHAALAEAAFSDGDEVRRARRDPARIGELDGLVRSVDSELAGLRARAGELEERTRGRTAPDEELARRRAAAAEMSVRQRSLGGDVGAARQRLAHLQERQERTREWRRQLTRLEDEREVWQQLAGDLRSNQFVEFLLSGVQRDLARHASRIIRRITRDRFDLQLAADGSFEVSDSWAEGAERRPARSLSGGETFIVSLALALALSDTIAGNRALGALFLDEGFGTLDPDTLDQVTGVLESLTLEGRMVGIITHVPELTERMPARLRVSRGEQGSTLAWEE